MSKILIAGDFCQKYRVDRIVKEKRFGELFDEAKHIIESVDYSIVNFEFPIVLNKDKTHQIPKCGPNLQGTIEAADAVKYAGFNCCTLANNHILDYGEQCCIDTKEALEQVEIDTVGAGRNLYEAASILYKVINDETIAVINCCEHEFSIATKISAGANPLSPIQQWYKIKEAKTKADYVIIIVHGGHEHYQLPSPRMKETYRFFIDAGADAVINHHQHCYSGYEIYNNCPIFYGLGNFLFDHCDNRYKIWNEGYMVTLEFSKDQKTFILHPYNQCNELPTVTLMNEKERMHFYKNIKKLNNIIADENQLTKEHETWIGMTSMGMASIFEPYIMRINKCLLRIGIASSVLNNKRRYQILNYINCESHLDRIKYVIKKRYGAKN